ncbi:condensation domain-containing protein, partial [Streptomyces sp. NPDC006704]|uniref:condensation domain-containing protein n=1 Tax=Streptomyces sp. NPDC006704 TaxID=3364760 RepID=UPI003687CB3A
RLVSRVRGVFGVELPVRAVFEAPTAGLLAARVARAGAARAPLVAGVRPQRIPLSYAQRRLWFAFRLEGPSPTYNCPLVLRFSGTLDRDALAGAVADVVARHESLRTRFVETHGEPCQQILPAGQAPALLDCLPPVTGETELAGLLREHSAYCFDLATETPFRATLFQQAPDQHVLLLLVHHIASDGWSMTPLARDLSTAYRTRTQATTPPPHHDSRPQHNPPPPQEPLAVQYADYTLWQTAVLGDPHDPDSVLARQRAYWTTQLTGAPQVLDLPLDRPRPAIARHHGATTPLSLSPALHHQLRTLARDHDVTLFMVLHAATAVLLRHLGAGNDLPIATVQAGRTDEALEPLIGFFVNTLILRTDLTGDPTFRQLLARVRETDLAAYAHQDLPLDHVIEALNPHRTLSHTPFTQIA